ncbi:SMI1/KNR4 family protein [Paenibacillus sp. CAU 1782]
MKLLDQISDQFCIEVSQEPSSKSEIELLIVFSSIMVPKEYLNIITQATEIEINVAKKIYVRIWGAKGCTEMNEAYQIQHYIPNSLAIGDDEGGRVFIYLDGSNGFGLYLIGLGNLDVEDAIFIAPALADFLINNTGVEHIVNEDFKG